MSQRSYILLCPFLCVGEAPIDTPKSRSTSTHRLSSFKRPCTYEDQDVTTDIDVVQILDDVVDDEIDDNEASERMSQTAGFCPSLFSLSHASNARNVRFQVGFKRINECDMIKIVMQ
jgi:hypothetical protein